MRRAIPKTLFTCVDGPFKGSKLWLSGDNKSAVFTVRGCTGRYVGVKRSVKRGVAVWEAA